MSAVKENNTTHILLWLLVAVFVAWGVHWSGLLMILLFGCMLGVWYLLKRYDIKHITSIWVVTILSLFAVLVLLGLLMRANQARYIDIRPDFFYAMMTLHGLGMAGILYIGGFAGLWYLLTRHIELKTTVMAAIYSISLISTVGVVVAALIGIYGPGWYMLYPLPFISTWYEWSIGFGNISLLILTLSWLIGQIEVMRAMVAKYGALNILGWQYFKSDKSQIKDVPPIIIITAVCMICGITTTIAGNVLVMLYIVQWIEPSIQFDPLLLKNIVFLFGHTIVNLTMYFGVAMVYQLLPEWTKRPWKSNKIVAIAWNTSLIFVLGAYLHHINMDFAQPIALRVAGQIMSYSASVPATVVTVFGVIGQVYRSGVKWDFVPSIFCLGIMGWVIGGFAAVVDSTVSVNFHFHNTMWVPAHFHTYFLMGYTFIMFGYYYYHINSNAEKLAKTSLWTMIVGGYGFLTMFYIGGFFGVPRRYASYDTLPVKTVAEGGTDMAGVATIFALVLVLGLILYYLSLFFGKNYMTRSKWSS